MLAWLTPVTHPPILPLGRIIFNPPGLIPGRIQLKAEYKVVHALCEQSSFGWDEGDQRVTVPLPVWEAYTKVCGFFFQCILLETKLT